MKLFYYFEKTTFSLLWLISSTPLAAQIVPDATLPNPTLVTPAGSTIRIEGGTHSGSNLLHSFQEFSIPTGSEAFFNNPLDIQNIFSRVTGSKISQIDGLIRTNGSANLFFLNPNGIIFGPHAQLNIGGSFFASTANSLRFADGSEFSATNPQISPLLTLKIPIGLQYGQTPGNIVYQSSASPSRGLQVPAGQTLGLMGGNILLEGGQLRSPQGKIELGSVGPNSLVTLTPMANDFAVGYEGVTSFQDIQLSQQAVVDTSGIGGGAIQVQANRLSVGGDSQILAITQGSQAGGDLTIRAADAVDIAASRLSTQTQGTGNGGNLTIETGQLSVRDGAVLSTETENAGKGGNLNLRTGLVTVSGSNPLNFTRLSTEAKGAGMGGNLTVETGQFLLQGTAFLSTATLGEGTGGNLNIQASDRVVLIGTGFESLQRIFGGAFLGQLSATDRIGGLFAGTGGLGTGGEIAIATGSLLLRNGAIIFSPTFGSAASGGIRIRVADSIDAVGAAILSNTSLGSSGAAGNITIDSNRLTLLDGTVVSSATFGSGKGGDVVVNAFDTVEVSRSIPEAVLPTGILNSTLFGTGVGGNIFIRTGRLINRDGGLIVANSGGRLSLGTISSGGPGGNIVIEARDAIEISGVSPDGLTTSGPGTTTFTAFPAGNLTISTRKLIIADGAIVSSATLSSGNGGILTVNASELVELKGKSSLTGLPTTLVTSSGRIDAPEAPATGASGDLRIHTGTLVVRDEATLDVRSFGSGSAGTLDVAANSIRLEDQGSLNASTVSGVGGNIQLRSQTLQLRRGSNIITNSGNTDGGNITLDADTLVALDNSDISANALVGRGGRVRINAQGIFGTQYRLDPTLESDITATGGTPALSGTVQINTPDVQAATGLVQLPENLTDVSRQIVAGCPAERGDRFVVTGRSGLPTDPAQMLTGQTVWRDLRPLAQGERRRDEKRVSGSESPSPQSPMIEAQGWARNAKGQLELVAQTSHVTPQIPWDRLTKCGGNG